MTITVTTQSLTERLSDLDRHLTALRLSAARMERCAPSAAAAVNDRVRILEAERRSVASAIASVNGVSGYA
jgi:hypothetical protein